jgi:hypothetical protein
MAAVTGPRAQRHTAWSSMGGGVPPLFLKYLSPDRSGSAGEACGRQPVRYLLSAQRAHRQLRTCAWGYSGEGIGDGVWRRRALDDDYGEALRFRLG